MLESGERQVSKTVEGIRRDHVARYEWAAGLLAEGCGAVDVCCGIGYGTKILADKGIHAVGLDRDEETIEYAKENYAHGGNGFQLVDVSQIKEFPQTSAVVCFEAVEHIEDPRPMLKAFNSEVLLVSVPNETVFPNQGYAFHHRHYTKVEFESLLNECGWVVSEWWGQEGPESEVEREVEGRTLIAIAIRNKVPKHVAILGLGPSINEYLEATKRLGGRKKYADETWGMNALGDVFICDKLFHMDDIRIQEIRAEARPESNIAAMVKWLKDYQGEVITSRAYPDYPCLTEFPLEDVLNEFEIPYFNSTAAYAIAYAVFIGVERISVFGADFTYPNSNQAEAGRGCVEFWLGIASARGIKITLPATTSLMDAMMTQEAKLYGYDTQDIIFKPQAGGRLHLDFKDKETLPTADEIENRYDHSAHPNPIVRKNEIQDS